LPRRVRAEHLAHALVLVLYLLKRARELCYPGTLFLELIQLADEGRHARRLGHDREPRSQHHADDEEYCDHARDEHFQVPV
jgi:hypothetical protein